MRKTILRMSFTVALAAVAATMAICTLAGFRSSPAVPAEGYLLADYGGSVAIFAAGDTETPVEVTEISLDSLREGDRALIESGLAVSSGEELAALLEDLGS